MKRSMGDERMNKKERKKKTCEGKMAVREAG
jgi:hypothetical protein